MTKPAFDHTGLKYGRLTAIKPASDPYKWLFRCDCGVLKEVHVYSARRGAVRSCGCLHIERCKTGLNRLRHGQAKVGRVTRLHNIWRGMIERADAGPEHKTYERYAGRGISICDEWRQYEVFHQWSTQNGYSDGLTIDRIDNDGSYGPENCQWATRKQQARNRRTSVFLTAFGQKKTLAEWSESSGIAYGTIKGRLDLGWPHERAVSEPSRRSAKPLQTETAIR